MICVPMSQLRCVRSFPDLPPTKDWRSQSNHQNDAPFVSKRIVHPTACVRHQVALSQHFEAWKVRWRWQDGVFTVVPDTPTFEAPPRPALPPGGAPARPSAQVESDVYHAQLRGGLRNGHAPGQSWGGEQISDAGLSDDGPRSWPSFFWLCHMHQMVKCMQSGVLCVCVRV
jgi:hypothetical protein